MKKVLGTVVTKETGIKNVSFKCSEVVYNSMLINMQRKNVLNKSAYIIDLILADFIIKKGGKK